MPISAELVESLKQMLHTIYKSLVDLLQILKFLEIWLSGLIRLSKLQKLPSRHLPLKVNNRNTRTRCEICSKLTIKTPERRQRHHTYFTPSSISSSSCIFISNVEHVIDGWVCDISLACEGLLMPPPLPTNLKMSQRDNFKLYEHKLV